MLLFSRYGAWSMDGQMYVIKWTVTWLATKAFEIDGLPNFLRYDALLLLLQRTGAPPSDHLITKFTDSLRFKYTF